MRFFTHNFLQCHAKKCIDSGKNFPLHITLTPCCEDTEKEILGTREQEFRDNFIRNQLHKIDWAVLLGALKECRIEHQLPESKPTAPYNTKLLRELHRVLLETFVISGEMRCQNCEHVYPIRDGIPNMLLHEDEL